MAMGAAESHIRPVCPIPTGGAAIQGLLDVQRQAPDIQRQALDVQRQAPDVQGQVPDVQRQAPDIRGQTVDVRAGFLRSGIGHFVLKPSDFLC